MSINKKKISRDTEQNLMLTLTAYWHKYKLSLDELLRRNVAQNRHIRHNDTIIVASVNDCSEQDLTKRLDNTNINYSVVEKYLIR